MKRPVSETDFAELNLLKRGKVRDIYDLGEYLLMVVSDRISAFDVVMPEPIPDKGIILTQISLFWFDVVESLIQNHVVAHDVNQFPEACRQYAEVLRDRSMLVLSYKIFRLAPWGSSACFWTMNFWTALEIFRASSSFVFWTMMRRDCSPLIMALIGSS